MVNETDQEEYLSLGETNLIKKGEIRTCILKRLNLSLVVVNNVLKCEINFLLTFPGCLVISPAVLWL